MWSLEPPKVRTQGVGWSGGGACAMIRRMAKWEYATVPLIVHATKQILDQWGEDGWELVQVVPGPEGQGLVAYLKRERGGGNA